MANSKHRVLVALLSTHALATPIRAAEPYLSIEVDVYNYSTLSGNTLELAAQETTRIFRRVHVIPKWFLHLNTPGEPVSGQNRAQPNAPTRFTLNLLSNAMAEKLPGGDDVFGTAFLAQQGKFGVVASINAEGARDLVKGRDSVVTLGRVMAHELGHLLLGTRGHAAAGIMHTPWRPEDLDPKREAVMSFLPREAKQIRAQVRARGSFEVAPEAQVTVDVHDSTQLPSEEPSRTNSRELTVTVLVYDYGKLPAFVLQNAMTVAQMIFRNAGIATQWVQCDSVQSSRPRRICPEMLGPAAVVLDIVRRAPPSIAGPEDGVGTALYDAGGHAATIAYVFEQRLEETARLGGSGGFNSSGTLWLTKLGTYCLEPDRIPRTASCNHTGESVRWLENPGTSHSRRNKRDGYGRI